MSICRIRSPSHKPVLSQGKHLRHQILHNQTARCSATGVERNSGLQDSETHHILVIRCDSTICLTETETQILKKREVSTFHFKCDKAASPVYKGVTSNLRSSATTVTNQTVKYSLLASRNSGYSVSGKDITFGLIELIWLRPWSLQELKERQYLTILWMWC